MMSFQGEDHLFFPDRADEDGLHTESRKLRSEPRKIIIDLPGFNLCMTVMTVMTQLEANVALSCGSA